MKIRNIVYIVSTFILTACGSGTTQGNDNVIPEPSPKKPMQYTTEYKFVDNNPLAGSLNKIQNTINPRSNKPIYQLDSINYGNKALILDKEWMLINFGNGTSRFQYLLLDPEGNVDEFEDNILYIHNPSTWMIINSYELDDRTDLKFAVINSERTNIYGFGSQGIYICPVSSNKILCNIKQEVSGLPKKLQIVNQVVYASYVTDKGENLIYSINLSQGNVTKYILDIYSPFQIDELVPDPISSNIIYVHALKANSLYMNIYKCNLNSQSCKVLYEDITSRGDIFMDMSIDENYLYFLHAHNIIPDVEYSIVKVNK